MRPAGPGRPGRRRRSRTPGPRRSCWAVPVPSPGSSRSRGRAPRPRRADVHVDHGVGLLTCGPQRIPGVGVHAGQAERGGVLREGDGMGSFRRAAPHLLRRQFRVPHRDEGERDQVAAGLVGAPFTDHPVVVGPDVGQREVTVAALEERLPAEPREGGEAQGRVGVIAVHVGQPGRPVVTAGQDVLEQHGPVVRLVAGGADRCEAAGDRRTTAGSVLCVTASPLPPDRADLWPFPRQRRQVR
jgi:hypothetical protein